jgi:hypothetical protein
MSNYKVRTKPAGFGETYANVKGGVLSMLGIKKKKVKRSGTRSGTTSPNQQPMQNIRRTN